MDGGARKGRPNETDAGVGASLVVAPAGHQFNAVATLLGNSGSRISNLLNPGSDAGWWRVKPGEEIRLVKENLAFAVSLWEAASAGKVPPEPILRPQPDFPQGPHPYGSPRQTVAEATAELSRASANQMRGAFAVSAMQAQRSMEAAFPGEPIHEEWPELRTARSAMYLIGLAVEHSILQPVWECPVPYRRLFHIRRLGFTLNAAAVEGRALSWDDFGGLRRYLALLDYCAASADAAEKAGDRGASRTLPEGPRPSYAEFGGVIGAPDTEEGEPEHGIGARPPRGYAGNAEETPADAWDIAIQAQEQPPELTEQTVAPPPPPPVAIGPGQANGGSTQQAPPASLINRFVVERCELGEDRRILAGELYAGFLGWCHDSGLDPVSQRAFGMRLTNLGLKRKRRGHGKHWWEGIRLA